MAGKAKIKYIQLDASAFLSDEDFQMMDAEKRGIYCTVIFYLLCNNGRVKNDLEGIKLLCNVRSEFEKKWESVMPKFYQKGVWLRHRRVDFELKKAKKKIQDAAIAGLKGAEKRWRPHKGSQGFPMAKGNEANSKRNKGNSSNSNTEKNSSLASNSFRFRVSLESIIVPKSRSDRTAIKNLSRWLDRKILEQVFDESIFSRILKYADESKGADNPAAALFATLNKEMGYQPKLANR